MTFAFWRSLRDYASRGETDNARGEQSNADAASPCRRRPGAAMIETLPTRSATSDIVVSAEALMGFSAFQDRLLGQSQIVWGEHCSECAYPKCYETCAFYT